MGTEMSAVTLQCNSALSTDEDDGKGCEKWKLPFRPSDSSSSTITTTIQPDPCSVQQADLYSVYIVVVGGRSPVLYFTVGYNAISCENDYNSEVEGELRRSKDIKGPQELRETEYDCSTRWVKGVSSLHPSSIFHSFSHCSVPVKLINKSLPPNWWHLV